MGDRIEGGATAGRSGRTGTNGEPGTSGAGTTGQWLDVGPADLLPGESKSVEAGPFNVALFNVNGTYHALEDVCTHDGGELSGGPFEGTVVTCPRHGAQFDVLTGAALCFPAVTPTAVFPVRVENGRILVSVGAA